jgi:glycosyltransferase involved in cell wall biosynthesis
MWADVVVLGMPIAEAAMLAHLVPRGRLAAYYICDPALPHRRLGKSLVKIVDRSAAIAVRRAATVVATSRDYARHSRVLSTVADRVVGIPPTLDLERMRPPDLAGQAHDGSLRIGYLGRVVHEKGLDVLVRAVARLEDRATLVLAGDADAVAGGSELARLEAMAAELGVELAYHGPLADEAVPAFLASVDVLALPSVSTLEAWGRVQAEAMLCGTPVVASALPGVRELVGSTGMGVTVPPGDVAALANALSSVGADPDRYRRPREEIIESLGLDRVSERHVATIAAIGRANRG